MQVCTSRQNGKESERDRVISTREKTHFKEYELAKVEEAWLADPVMSQWSYRPEG